MSSSPARVSFSDLLRVPCFARLFVASMAGRLPQAALGLVFILRTRELTGSYAAGGAVAASYALANGVTAPALGRLVDRRGQAAVLMPAALIGSAALVVFALLGPGAPVAVAMACAAVAGASFPPLGACLRTLWPSLLGEDPARTHAAFMLESAALEVTYIAGPVVIAGAIGSQSTAAATLACAVLLLLGTATFALSAASRAWRSPAVAAASGFGALRAPGVRTLMVVFLLLGATFGSVEVAVPVAAEAAGVAGATGVLLGIWGTGSLIGGLVAARAGAPADPVRRLTLVLAALAAGHLLLTIPTGPLVLAGLLLVAGLAIAPAIAGAYTLVDGVAPAGTITEAYTWLTTGIAAGLAIGAALTGALAESHGAGAAFATAGAACALAAVAGSLGRGTLVPARALPAAC